MNVSIRYIKNIIIEKKYHNRSIIIFFLPQGQNNLNIIEYAYVLYRHVYNYFTCHHLNVELNI